METGASAARGGGGSRGRRDQSAVLHNAGEGGHAGGPASDAALELLRSDPTALEGAGEGGLSILDARLPLDASNSVDLLASDAQGSPVLLLFCGDDEGAALGRIGRVVGAFRRVGPLLRVAYGERGLDVTRAPRVLLLAARFSDEMPDQLDLLGAVSIAALEYRLVRPRGGEPLLDVALFHRSTADGGRERSQNGSTGPATPTPKPLPVELEGEPDELTAMELEPLSPDDLDGLLDRAYQSISSLSEQVSATDEGERIRFLVDGRPLASLLRDEAAGSLTLTLDEEGGVLETLSIADEAGLNAALNALFDRFFQELDPAL